MSLLRIESLRLGFGDGPDVLDGLSLELDAGQSLGLLGSSGSGKSMTALAVMGLLPPTATIRAGKIFFEGRDLLTLDPEERRLLRGGGIGLVFQEPFSALNPLMRVGDQIAEALALHQGLAYADAQREAAVWLERVGLTPGASRARAYPHQYSGGMRQRALLAMALAGQPRLLIADEPTTALDSTVQAQMLQLIRALQSQMGFALIIISHDLAVIHALAEQALVLDHGHVAQRGSLSQMLQAPSCDALTRLLEAQAVLSAPQLA